MIRLILLIFVASLIPARMSGAFTAPEFNFTHYTTENILPSNSVRDIVQGPEGFMWFATDGGLVRFDGTTSKVMVPEDEDGADFFIHSLCNSDKGLIVGSDRMLYRYDSRKECLVPFPLRYSDKVKEEISGVVEDISTDSTGGIWVSVDGKGVFHINSDDMVDFHQDFPEIANFIGMIYVDASDIVWCVSTANRGGMYRFDRGRARFEPFEIKIGGNKTQVGALAMMCDTHGDYWLATWDQGILRFNGRTGAAEWVLGTEDAGRVWHVHSIMEYSPSMLLVGSDSGLTLIDKATGDCRVYKSDELNPQSLSDRFVYPIVRDEEGGLWVGTYYRGVNYMSRDSQRFRRWNHSRFANSVSGNVISRFCEDERGDVWIGSADGGLCRYEPDTGHFTHYPLGGKNETDNVNALLADGDRLWIGTYSKGAGVLDMKTGAWRKVSVEGDYVYSSYAMSKDNAGNVWMASTDMLTRYNKENDSFENVANLGAWIIGIEEDRNGELWIATQGRGLFRMNTADGKMKNYTTSKMPGGLPHNHINCVHVGSDGEVYVATIYGVYRYDRKNDSFEHIDMDAPNIVPLSVVKSGDDLWVATTSGLVRVNGAGKTRLFTYADGISDNQFVPGASLHASDGKIYYGTVHGFCRVDPMEARNNAAPPKIKFTGLDIINTPVEVGERNLTESLNSIDRLIMTHADHTFSIYFSALSYANPSGNAYRYRLEGFDKSWHEVGKDNRATYSNLPSGDYVLRVQAANADDVWNDEGISLRIVVEPAWYASVWMKTLYVLAGVALLLLGLRYMVSRMERNHVIELDRILGNKEKEMFRSKMKFFTVVAHEIRTPVSLIIGPLEKILDSKEEFSTGVKDDLKVIQRNARRLLSLVNQLLDFKKVEDNALTVGFRSELITPLIENVTERFRPSLEQKGVSLTVSCPPADVRVDVDPEAVTKLVSNLLNNARKFTKDMIRLECQILPDGKRFMISVEDNGIGITKENRDKIFKPFFQVFDNISEARGGTGLGLSIVKSVVDAHGGEIELDSVPGKGSKFTAIFPVRQENVMPAEETDVVEPDAEPQDAVVKKVDGSNRPVLLVVDDNEEMVRFVSSSFDANYEVVTANNGKVALEKMSRHSVSLIICDWMMPVMDGVEFLKRVRGDERFCHVPFVMLTAKTDNMSKIETMKSGADFYLEKPFSTNYLAACVANLLEMRTMLKRKFADMPLEPMTTLASTQVDNEFLTRLQTLIEENFSNPELNVEFLADHIGISRSGLYTKIRSLADVTPNELIQITRLKRAAALLKEGKYRINEVSYMVGFNSSSYFARCFQKQFGMKPGDFAAES
ncbi:MAG: response regulator [Muribaculaceae bacterium]